MEDVYNVAFPKYLYGASQQPQAVKKEQPGKDRLFVIGAWTRPSSAMIG
jgi:hypothetical protein